MRKSGSLIGAAAALVLTAAFASPGVAQSLTAGAKAGIGFANLGGDFEEIIETSAKTKTGFSAGGFFGIDLHRLFRLQFEGQYVQKGAKAEEAGLEATFNVDYLELLVPLTLLIPVEGARVTPRVYAGGSVAYESSCEAELSDGTTTVTIDCGEDPIKAETESVDFGVFFGGGVDFMVGPGAITLDVLYNLGLRDVNAVVNDPATVKNKNIQILVGYGFRFGG